MERSRLRPTRRSLGVAAVVVLLVAVGLVAALATRPTRTSPAFRTAEEILEDPVALYGQRVRVRDRVARMVAATAVTIGSRETGAEVLVFDVAVVPAMDDLADDHRTPVGDLVAVEGWLRPFDIADFEAEVGELDESRYQRFEGRPALVAEVVDPAPRVR